MKVTRLSIEWAILLALSILGAFALQSSQATHRLDNQLLDNLSALARPALPDDIAIVAIDDASLDAVGAWPWPRSRHAEIVERLDAAGARLIVLDILFIEPTSEAEDMALAEAMRASGKVVVPHAFVDRMNAVSGVDPLLPLPVIAGASAQMGHVAAEPDADGILRRFDLGFVTDEARYAHLAVQAARLLGEEPADIPSRAIVPFHPEQSIPHQSASDIIAGSFLPELFEGKIVLVGATAAGMGDRYSVASGEVGLMTGVETQANLLTALRADALITPVAAVWQNALAVAALIVLFACFWFLPPRASLYVAIALVAVLLAASIALLVTARMWLPAAPAIIVILLAYPLWSWRRLSHVSRYLDREAARMRGDRPPQRHEGMEYVARQVERVRGLIHSIRDRLSFLRQVIEAAPDAMIVVDERGQVQMLNAQAEALFAGWQELTEASVPQLFAHAGAQTLADGGEMLSRDGRSFLIARARLQGGSASGESGEFLGEILALREITDIRKLDEERKQMLEFLSHDMRNPQVAIIGLTRQQENAASDGETMERIRNQADRTLKLADDFVQLARLESPELQIEDSDLGALIEEACDRAFVIAQSKRIVIAQNLPEEPCFADVDPSLIARMLDNLIGNAIKFSPEDSQIELALSCERDCGHSGSARIVVADNGIGLSEARMSDPFARFGAHATHAGPSAGLGLALVKKVVDAHHGTIEVVSRKGEGTRFTMTLPGGQAG